MGLFRRRDASDRSAEERDAEIAALRDEITELRRELATRLDGESRELRSELDAARTAMTDRVDTEATAIRTELATVRDRIDPVAVDVSELAARLQSIDERFSRPLTEPPPPPPPELTPAPSASDRRDLDSFGTQLTRLEERITAVDRRVTAVSTELANQLAEIDADIETLTKQRDEASPEGDADEAEPVDDARGAPQAGGASAVDVEMLEELLDEVRDAQQRLANEQARYQIAFRDDLARLAEDLRRRANR